MITTSSDPLDVNLGEPELGAPFLHLPAGTANEKSLNAGGDPHRNNIADGELICVKDGNVLGRAVELEGAGIHTDGFHFGDNLGLLFLAEAGVDREDHDVLAVHVQVHFGIAVRQQIVSSVLQTTGRGAIQNVGEVGDELLELLGVLDLLDLRLHRGLIQLEGQLFGFLRKDNAGVRLDVAEVVALADIERETDLDFLETGGIPHLEDVVRLLAVRDVHAVQQRRIFAGDGGQAGLVKAGIPGSIHIGVGTVCEEPALGQGADVGNGSINSVHHSRLPPINFLLFSRFKELTLLL